jgi:hypothetical protein
MISFSRVRLFLISPLAFRPKSTARVGICISASGNKELLKYIFADEKRYVTSSSVLDAGSLISLQVSNSLNP